MADISKPEEVSAEQEGPTSAQDAAQQDDPQQELGGVGGVEVPPCPHSYDQTTDSQNDAYEYLRTRVAIGALVVSMFALLISSGSYYSSKRSVDIAATVLRITQSNERPWVSVEVRVPKSLVFSKEGNLGLAIDVDVKDVGRAVALDMTYWAELVFLDPDGDDTAAQERQWERCKDARYPPPPSEYVPGVVLFPGAEAIHLSVRAGKWAKDIAPEIARALPANKGKVGFAIIGCISYRAAFEEISLRRHQTPFLYRVVQWGDDGKPTYFIKPQGNPKNIVLGRMPYGNAAD